MAATRTATHLLLLLCALSLLSLTCSAAKISYEDHCGSVVPASVPTGVIPDDSQRINLHVYRGFCADVGRKIFSSKTGDSNSTCMFSFFDQQIHETRDDRVLQVGAGLHILSGESSIFRLWGFWSISTGKLCMIGSGYSRRNRLVSVILKLNYPSASNVSTSLVTGTLETLEADANGLHRSYDKSPLVLAYNVLYNYEYTMINRAKKSCSVLKLEENGGEEPLAIRSNASTCFELSALSEELYLSSPIGNRPLAIEHSSLPAPISLYSFQCSDSDRDGKLRFSIRTRIHNITLPTKAPLAVAEGFWDGKRNRLCAVACPILEDKISGDLYVGDCDVGFSLWFPAALTLRNRSTVLGRMWSNKKAEEDGHFGMVSFQGGGNLRGYSIPAGMKYRYTYQLATVESFCKANHEPKIWKKRLYPDGRNAADMQFQMHLKDAKGHTVWGSAYVISIGETLFGNHDGYTVVFSRVMSAAAIVDPDISSFTETNTPSVWNISYKLSWISYDRENLNGSSSMRDSNISMTYISSTNLDAEGIYNPSTGQLCMVGCRSMNQGSNLSDSGSTLDCEVAVRVQFAPVNREAGDHTSGTIASTRKNSDPLYFEPIEFSSDAMYTGQAKATIRRMDTEVLAVIFSLTLLCACIVGQLRHGKRNPGVLPSISITMLVVLALGQMIPLVLNFEALFFAGRRGDHNILLSNGGWLEANEVIVRIMTMIAFLLQCRLLQMAFSSRLTDQDSNRGLWSAEKEALIICFPLYLAGGLVIWFVDNSTSHAAVAEELISYAGLVLDGFLLPQIVLNLYRNSKNEALTPFFYAGTTAVRVLPHLYDLYRSRHYLPHFYSSYLFARPGEDFYSSAWDVMIPCVGVLFALLLFLQQRFGGQCILPTRCSRSG